MTKTILAAIGISAAIMLGSSASARTISDFLSTCSGNDGGCREVVSDIIVNGKDAHYICVPKGRSTREAAEDEIDWLNNKVGRSPRFAIMNEQNAMWAGAKALWPCNGRRK